MSISTCILTKKGQALLAKTPIGAEIPVTRWQFGTGVLPAEQAEADLTALVAPLQYFPISSKANSGNKCTVLGQFVNTGMSEFVWEELGLWATDPDEGEILYAVGEARGNGELIEAGTAKLREFIFGMELTFDNAANVTAVIDSSLIFATKEELEGYAQLGEDGKVLAEQLPEMDYVPNSEKGEPLGVATLDEEGKVAEDQLPSMGGYRRAFEVEEWENGELRIPQTEHGLTPTKKHSLTALRQRADRTALDYYGDTSAAQGRAGIVNAMKAALATNNETPGTYPTASDGYVQLTWYQVQYYLLEGVLVSDAEAQAQATAKGFDWQDRDITGAPQTATLDQVLAAAYIPALDGSSTAFDALCTDAVLQGLRLRRKAAGAGTVERYDLDGKLVMGGWAAFEAHVYWDLDTDDLVISGSAFAGDVSVLV